MFQNLSILIFALLVSLSVTSVCPLYHEIWLKWEDELKMWRTQDLNSAQFTYFSLVSGPVLLIGSSNSSIGKVVNIMSLDWFVRHNFCNGCKFKSIKIEYNFCWLQHDIHWWMDRRMERQMDEGLMNGWTDGWTDE